MFLRATILASAMIAASGVAALADTSGNTPARCEEMNFRVYFAEGSATLDPAARQVLRVAQRNIAGCSYRELHVRLDPVNGQARARGNAILRASRDETWNVARLEARSSVRRASMNSGPDFAEVVMTPQVLPATAPLVTGVDVGV